MAKFNTTHTSENNTKDTVNAAGFDAFSRDFKKEVASIVLNSMVNGDSYYQTETERLKSIEKIISANVDEAEFLAKAMVYARTEGNLRSVAHYMAGMLIENVKGSTFLKPAIGQMLIRPDDATETVALWNSRIKNLFQMH